MDAGNSQPNNPPEDNRMEDTLSLARLEREKQGPWEAEVSYGEEADLHKHLIGCVKNPGHHQFVPVDQFNVGYLPPGCHDKDLVDYVRAMSDLTALVSVKHVSEERPETVPGSDKPYPSYKDRGSNMMRTGTGWVCAVYIHTNKDNSYTTCECQECLNSLTPKTQFAEIHIQTAAHVVYDELEATHTTCYLFFDKGGRPRDCSGVVTLSGWSDVSKGSNGDDDWCEMIHMTHDLDVAGRLHKMMGHWRNLRENIDQKYEQPKSEKQKKSSSLSEYLPKAWDKLTIIVSHPHGCSKQISVGYCTDWDETSYPIQLRYKTATCPGSSGAPMIVFRDAGYWFWSMGIVHCGNCEDNKNLNYSSATYQVTRELFMCPAGQ